MVPRIRPPGTRTAPSRTGMVQRHGSESSGTATRRTALTSGTSAAEYGAHSRRYDADPIGLTRRHPRRRTRRSARPATLTHMPNSGCCVFRTSRCRKRRRAGGAGSPSGRQAGDQRSPGHHSELWSRASRRLAGISQITGSIVAAGSEMGAMRPQIINTQLWVRSSGVSPTGAAGSAVSESADLA